MRILLVSTKVPYPPTDGGRIAIYEPLRQLAKRGHEVSLLALSADPINVEVGDALRQYCHLEVIEHDTRNHLVPAICNMASPLPYTISKYLSQEMRGRIKLLLGARKYDLVHLENLHTAAYHSTVADEFHLPVLLRQQNVESTLAHRYSQTQTGLRKWYGCLQAAKLKRYEAAMCSKMDLCMAITPEDAEQMHQLNPLIKTEVVPAGVDTMDFAPQMGVENPKMVVLLGAMDWPPNVDAALWFSSAVLPIIRDRFGDIQFYIVGKNAPGKIQALTRQPGITVTGFVNDVRSYLGQAAVFVVPLRSGGGMRLKILQAMAMGKATVSTSIGAEGIHAQEGRDLLLADSAESFADSVIRLLKTPDLRAEIGRNARELVCSRYTWEHSADLLEQAYSRALHARID